MLRKGRKVQVNEQFHCSHLYLFHCIYIYYLADSTKLFHLFIMCFLSVYTAKAQKGAISACERAKALRHRERTISLFLYFYHSKYNGILSLFNQNSSQCKDFSPQLHYRHQSPSPSAFSLPYIF